MKCLLNLQLFQIRIKFLSDDRRLIKNNDKLLKKKSFLRPVDGYRTVTTQEI